MTCPGSLEQCLFRQLAKQRKTLAVAESCTGGLIAHRVTGVPGVSEFFLGGVVAYSNEAKIKLLGVDPDDIAQYGAVSDTVAQEMAEGARACFGADIAVGVTGIAGPGGGTLEKPVGLVYISVAGAGKTVVSRNEFAGDRDSIKAQSAEMALRMVLEALS